MADGQALRSRFPVPVPPFSTNCVADLIYMLYMTRKFVEKYVTKIAFVFQVMQKLTEQMTTSVSRQLELAK
jgi:hypothetical protein